MDEPDAEPQSDSNLSNLDVKFKAVEEGIRDPEHVLPSLGRRRAERNIKKTNDTLICNNESQDEKNSTY